MLACPLAVSAERDGGDRVLSLLTAHCSDCHGKTKPEAALCFDDLRTDFAGGDSADESLVETWQRIHEQITLGAMPPEGSSQLSVMEVDYVTEWITRQLRKVGQTPNVWHKLQSPQFGNYVSHEKLFDGSHRGPGSSPPRLWRLSPYIYDEFLNGFGRHLREITAVHQPFALDTSRGEIADFAAQQVAGEATLQLLMMNCRTLAEYQTTGVVFRDHESKLRNSKRTPAEFEAILRSQDEPTDEMLRAAIVFEFELLLERVPSESEFELLVGFFRKAAKVG